jgi:hypothetical protein
MVPERWSKVERLYQAALEHEPADRIAFLEQACTEEELRREVESLLQYEEHGDRLFEHRPWPWRAGLGLGARLGPYRLEAWMGEGGMGVVYRALVLSTPGSIAPWPSNSSPMDGPMPPRDSVFSMRRKWRRRSTIPTS